VDAASHLQALTHAQGSLIRKLLRDKKTRSSEGAFVVEGAKSCLDLIGRYPQSIRSLILSSRYLRGETDADRRIRSELHSPQLLCPDAVFEKLSDVEMPQGMLAVVRQPRWDEAQVFTQPSLLGIYGDRLQDPANVGAIIRTAAAMNLSGVWLSVDSADPFSPKVVRATAGTILSLPVWCTRDVRIFALSGCELYSARLPSAHTVPIRSIQRIPSRLVIAVGNEGMGLASDVVQASQVTFSIPLAQGVESLNVAATVAISAFYFRGLPCDSPGISPVPKHSV
jgi:RNA methyltransferase, TrmH family